ncbi:hypothetical protein BROUX41_000219 [Berkeleyomyces rouxiae]|uniref:uncharacterized protein n=1 Tax=Berkeleyomyces rouxiae TaxID=2035830 RepID=UPI003B7E7048
MRRSARLASMVVDPISKTVEQVPKRKPPARNPPTMTRKRKSDASEAISSRVSTEVPSSPPTFGEYVELPELPGTPTRKRRPQRLSETPSALRLAASNLTAATLVSPESARIVPPSSPGTIANDFKIDRMSVHINNKDTLLEDALRHLVSVDSRMAPLIEKHDCSMFSPEGLVETVDPWEGLVSSIISQQVSGAAAKSIKRRFVALFSDQELPDVVVKSEEQDESNANGDKNHPVSFPTPSQVINRDLLTLRTAGLSQRKAEYIHGLAEKFTTGELSADLFARASYDDLVRRLTAVRGLGLWSVEMFACFVLRRPDVFSLGDLGVQRGMAAFLGRDVARLRSSSKGKWKYMSEQEMKDISAQFAPYRSIFMWYMWRVEDTSVEAMESGTKPAP